MASSTGDLVLVIKADSKDATAQVAAVQAAVEAAGSRIKAFSVGMAPNLRAVGDSARQAAVHTKGFADSLRAFVREERQEDRLGSYFLRQLADIAPLSDGAKLGIMGLAGAFIGGFGLGMAIDATVIAGRMLAESWEEQRKKANDYAKAIDAVGSAAQNSNDQLRRFYAARAGVGEATAGALKSEEMKKLEEEEQAAKQRLRELQAQRAVITSGPVARKMRSQGMSQEEIEKRFRPGLAAFDKENADEIARATDIVTGAEEKRREILANAGRLDRTAASDAKIASDIKVNALQSEMQALGALTETRKLEIDQERALYEIDQRIRLAKGNTIANLNAERSATQRLYEERRRIAGANERARAAQPMSESWTAMELGNAKPGDYAAFQAQQPEWYRNSRKFDLQTAGEQAESYGQAEIDMAGTAEMHVFAAAAAKQHQADVEKLASTYAMFGSAGVDALAAVAFHGATVEQAMVQMSESIVVSLAQAWVQQQALELAKATTRRAQNVSSVVSEAGVAGAGAAAEAAPILGPASVGVGAAVAESIIAAFGPMASAAGGMKVPRDMIAQIHKDEWVLPARISKGMERVIAGGGGAGGGGPTYNLSFFDPRSAARAFDDRSSELNRALRAEQRRSRSLR
jgi:hypothetical protein